jgi:hypothetical protein
LPCATLSMLAYYPADIEKLTLCAQLPIWGSMFPFWSPTGDLV